MFIKRLIFAFSAALVLSSCGSSSESDPGHLTVRTYDSADPSVPKTVYQNDDGDRLEVFGSFDNSGQFQRDQAVISADEDTEAWRVFFGEDGLPQRINNETTGAYTIATPLNRGLRFDTYNAAGEFEGGIALINDPDSGWLYAAVTGSPLFSGQITGQLSGDISGSFTVTPLDTAGLGPLQPIPAALQQYFESNIQSKSIASGIESIAEIGADAYLILGGVAAGLFVLPGGQAAAIPTAQAAAIAFGASLVANALQNKLETWRNELEDDESRDMFDSIIGTFSRDGMSPRQFVNNAANEIKNILENGTSTAQDLFGGAETSDVAGDEDLDIYDAPRDLDFEPTPADAPPPTETAVEGFGVDEESETYEFSGTVGTDGSIDLTGINDTSGNYLDVTGNLGPDGSIGNGAFDGSKGSGSVEGEIAEFGDCSVVQQSGGQGTFSFSHDIGNQGWVDFFYEAYSIPDAFDVFSDGGQIFSTGGLVSGNRQLELLAPGRFVSVIVSAPEDGTAWEYELGCAKQ